MWRPSIGRRRRGQIINSSGSSGNSANASGTCKLRHIVIVQVVGAISVLLSYRLWIASDIVLVDGIITQLETRAKLFGMDLEQPEDCRELINKAKSNQIENPDAFQRKTETRPSFHISIHAREFDKVRWYIYEHGVYYEKDMERIWRYILGKTPPGSRVLDVGGNIGYYSLVSASLDPQITVDAFEPNAVNRIRFCESLELNGWLSATNDGDGSTIGPIVNIYPMGISDRKDILTFYAVKNPGGGSFVKLEGGKYPPRSTPIELPVTTLDEFAKARGWLHSQTRPDISILKIDVERHEAQVLLGARQFIKQKLARNIFTETSRHAVLADEESQRETLTMLVTAGYTLAAQGGFHGPNHRVTWEQGSTLPETIIANLKDTTQRGRDYMNLWWTLDDFDMSLRQG